MVKVMGSVSERCLCRFLQICLYVNTFMFCAFAVCVTSPHLKCTWIVFMSDFMECNPKTSKVSGRHGSSLSVWRITPLIMCGATGMTYIQIMFWRMSIPKLATRWQTSIGNVLWFPCSGEEILLFIPPQGPKHWLGFCLLFLWQICMLWCETC